MVISVDIDGVLTVGGRGHSEKAYQERRPNIVEIREVNRRFSEGHTIILYTARHWVDYAVTKRWLIDNAVSHHELVMGKPLSQLFIDDRSCHSFSEIVNYDFSKHKCPRVRLGLIDENELHPCFFCGEMISVETEDCPRCHIMPCPSCGKCYCSASFEEKYVVWLVHSHLCQNILEFREIKLPFHIIPEEMMDLPVVKHCSAAVLACHSYQNQKKKEKSKPL